MSIQEALGRKIVCLCVIFNSILTILFSGDLLYALYIRRLKWHAGPLHILNYSSLLLIMVGSFLNIVTAKIIGNVNLRRVRFHHYFYGFLMMIVSLALIMMLAPAYLSILLMPILLPSVYSLTPIPISMAFLLTYGGITLVIDDIQDLSMRIRRSLNLLWRRALKFKSKLEALHLCSCISSAYMLLSMLLRFFIDKLCLIETVIPKVSIKIFILNLFVTSLWGLEIIKRRFWLRKLL